ncbi:hypothetical protein AAFF_G00263870 [Aldrovandia affinis]|uniref:J domain-containing protein n=1 Tax=Aldrovandia affinis TaxID=143900 RepID=A0AAD7SSP9_9TELE|nr:hypothetical protein AAFF_G00263870 [Aldrovandia affinis]
MQSMQSNHLASAVCLLLLCLIIEANRDYYDIMDVPQSASDRQIKKAFHKLAMKYHPDKNNRPDAEIMFREIAEAYEVLSNDEKRRRYDDLGLEAFKTDTKDEATFDANIFRFSLEEFFLSLGLRDDLFLEDFPEDIFQMGDDDEGGGGSFFDGDFLDLLGEDINEMSSDHKEDAFQDPETGFCWMKMHSDGSTTREEAAEGVRPGLSISIPSIRVTEALKNVDSLVFVVKSQELSSNQEHHVERTFEDFEWLQHGLFTQEDVTGLQGVIFPPLPAKPVHSQSNSQAKVLKQLGVLAMGEDWRAYCRALQKYLQQVAAHTTLGKNTALQGFLTHTDPPGKQRVRKGLFNRLSQAVEEKLKENHKDVDDFFQNERDDNLTLTGLSRAATEKFLDMVLAEEKIALACGHFSTSLQVGIGPQEDPTLVAFSKICLKLSEVIDTVKKNFESIAENNLYTLGLALDLDLRYQEAEKEMLFRRTCKLVELENANKNAEKAKPLKKEAMEEIKKAAEKEFDHISTVAKLEIERFRRVRVEVFQQSLVEWCESQLRIAKETSATFAQQLTAFRLLGEE